MSEEVLHFDCEGEQLFGILHRPAEPRKRAVLIVVGGPQTRVGSHRQFVLLARTLAESGYACLRFDYRGMGDSSGEMRGFEEVDNDIGSALEALSGAVPDAEDLVIWGLCDAASAALFHAPKEPRLSGLVLLNPWVRSEQGLARSYLKHYYLQRLISRAMWGKVLRGEFDYRASLTSFFSMLRKAAARGTGGGGQAPADQAQSPQALPELEPLADRMAAGLSAFGGATMFILSGRDLTAGEFKQAVKDSRRWRSLLRRSKTTVHHFPEADHTFASRRARDQVARWTLDWLEKH